MRYKQSLLAMIDFIENNLKTDITLQDISNASFFATSQLHSIFSSGTGHGIKEYIMKRRLTEAAKELIDSKKPIIDIAVDYIYGSQEAFTRAFKNHFGTTPAKYRRDKTHRIYCYRDAMSESEIAPYLLKRFSPTPGIKVIDSIQLMGVVAEGMFSDTLLEETWDRFLDLYHSFTCGETLPYYALFRYEDVGIKEITPDTKCSFFVGFDIALLKKNYKKAYGLETKEGILKKFASYLDTPSQRGLEASTAIIEGMKYAIFNRLGLCMDVAEIYRYIFSEWLPKSCYQVANAFDFEYYHTYYKKDKTQVMECDIYVPIK